MSNAVQMDTARPVLPSFAPLLMPDWLPEHDAANLRAAAADLIRLTARWAERKGWDYETAADLILCAALQAARNGLAAGHVAARAEDVVDEHAIALADAYGAVF